MEPRVLPVEMGNLRRAQVGYGVIYKLLKMKRMIMKELHDRIVRQKTFIAEVSVIGEPWRIPQYSNREEIIHVKRANKYLDRQ